MPCFRGVEIFLTLSAQNAQIPEYPHPEGPSVRLCSSLQSLPRAGSSLSSASLTSPFQSEMELLHTPKTDPTTSVYIPSVPGSPFAINYHITNQLSSNFVYFKMCMNGQSVISWGTDRERRPSGSVARSYWKPSNRLQDEVGVEGRSFLFTSTSNKPWDADGGGLIEVKVFRAKNRKVVALSLEEFWSQEHCGIVAPSIGLHERPEELAYFSWALEDLKEKPYATFKFYYRSWESLRQHNIAPSHGPSFLQFASTTNHSQCITKAAGEPSEPYNLDKTPSSESEALYGGALDVYTQDDQEDCSRMGMTSPECHQQPGILKSLTRLRPRSSQSNSNLPQPSKALRDGNPHSYLQRPLPELASDSPKKAASELLAEPLSAQECSLSRHSSTASTASATPDAPSLTNSLVRLADEASSGDMTIPIQAAQVVRLSRACSVSRIDLDQRDDSEYEDVSVASDYDDSPGVFSSCEGVGFKARTKVAPMAPENPPKPQEGSQTSKTLAFVRSASTTLVQPLMRFHDSKSSHSAPLPMADWLRKTPSPVMNQSPHTSSTYWSPRPQKKSGRASLPGLGRGHGVHGVEMEEVFYCPKPTNHPNSSPFPISLKNGVDNGAGNWI